MHFLHFWFGRSGGVKSIEHPVEASIFALFGKAASGGKQVKQGLRLNP